MDPKEGIFDFDMFENIDYDKHTPSYSRRYSNIAEFDPFFKKKESEVNEPRILQSLNIENYNSNTPLSLSGPRKLKKGVTDSLIFDSSSVFYSLEGSKSVNHSKSPLLSNFDESFTMLKQIDHFNEISQPKRTKKSQECSINSVDSQVHRQMDTSDSINFADAQYTASSCQTTTISIPAELNQSPSNKIIWNNERNSENDRERAELESFQEQNNGLKNVIILYEQLTERIEPYLAKVSDEFDERYENLKSKFEQNYEETQYLDRAYKYTYKRYEELKESYAIQRDTEVKLHKSNSELRKAVELSGGKIDALMKEISTSKRNFEDEITRLQTTVKLNSVKINGLKKDIEEITRQKHELTLICEEFLAEKQQKM